MCGKQWKASFTRFALSPYDSVNGWWTSRYLPYICNEKKETVFVIFCTNLTLEKQVGKILLHYAVLNAIHTTIAYQHYTINTSTTNIFSSRYMPYLGQWCLRHIWGGADFRPLDSMCAKVYKRPTLCSNEPDFPIAQDHLLKSTKSENHERLNKIHSRVIIHHWSILIY